jgi:hypothetical protein
MRRVAQVENEPEPPSARMRHCGKKTGWTPRERRLKHEVPVVVKAGTETMQGTTQNISKSGVLFHSEACFEEGTKLELIFEMPGELTGEKSAQVVCHSTVARVSTTTVGKKETINVIACSISGYDFVEDTKREPNGESANVVEFSRRKRHA